MTHYKKYFDKEFLGSWDLPDRDVVLTIEKCTAGELTSAGGRKAKKPVLWFRGTPKRMAINATNGKAIAGLYGDHVEKWAGQRISVYKTTTQMGGDTVECIRVRPQAPAAKAKNDEIGDGADPANSETAEV